jgi:hypothetical protein
MQLLTPVCLFALAVCCHGSTSAIGPVKPAGVPGVGHAGRLQQLLRQSSVRVRCSLHKKSVDSYLTQCLGRPSAGGISWRAWS